MTEKVFHIAVLGRTLEHLGVQMYKRRDTAIAELVANCWDANAKNVWITIPIVGYSAATSRIIVEDDGDGMNDTDVEERYLVVGRNRRRDATVAAGTEANTQASGRKVMGRKGIGKLAGFGIAARIGLTTWRDGVATALALNIDDLKLDDKEMRNVDIPGNLIDVPPDVRDGGHGTRLVLSRLKHSTAPDVDRLREALARRFSRSVRGEMTIYVNDEVLTDPTIDWEYRVPSVESGDREELYELPSGDLVGYFYGFSKTVLQSREMRGFTVLANGKTAQASPFFFDVETRASGQHGTRYMTGIIEADFLDSGEDDDSDLISTDRQEIDWEAPETKDFREWGAALTRKALSEFRDYRAANTTKKLLENDNLRERVERLDKKTKEHAIKLLGSVGLLDADDGKELELASSLVAAFEYRQFHDVVDDIEAAADDPERLQMLLENIANWKALEGRAILEVIKGRISIIDKFHALIVGGAAETAHEVGDENLHDLIGSFPWLLDAEWQVLSEEKSISKQLREWAAQDKVADLEDGQGRKRYDFLALEDQRTLVVIEIKRANYAPTVEDIHRLLQYKKNLQRGQDERNIVAFFISSDNFEDNVDEYRTMSGLTMVSWGKIHTRTKAYYEHYRALLEGEADATDFANKSTELARTRAVLERGSHRGPQERARGVGPQDGIRERLDAEESARAMYIASDDPRTGEEIADEAIARGIIRKAPEPPA